MDAQLALKVQSAAPGQFVELFKIDLTPVNKFAGIVYVYPGSQEIASLGAVFWLGNEYFPLPMELTGVEFTGKGAIPRPVLTISNVHGTVSGLITTWGGVAGA